MSYYPPAFLKECKYIEKKVIRQIFDRPESSSSDSDRNRCFFINIYVDCVFVYLLLTHNVFIKNRFSRDCVTLWLKQAYESIWNCLK